jgi:hypothetical protein
MLQCSKSIIKYLDTNLLRFYALKISKYSGKNKEKLE